MWVEAGDWYPTRTAASNSSGLMLRLSTEVVGAASARLRKMERTASQ